jgi:hypothetical protein
METSIKVMTGETDVLGGEPGYYKSHAHWPAVEPGPAKNGVHGTTNLCRKPFKPFAYIREFVTV